MERVYIRIPPRQAVNHQINAAVAGIAKTERTHQKGIQAPLSVFNASSFKLKAQNTAGLLRVLAVKSNKF